MFDQDHDSVNLSEDEFIERVDLPYYDVAHSLIPGSSEHPSYYDVLVALKRATEDRDKYLSRLRNETSKLRSLQDDHRNLNKSFSKAEEDRDKYEKLWQDSLSCSHSALEEAHKSELVKIFLISLFSCLISSSFVIRVFDDSGSSWFLLLMSLLFSIFPFIFTMGFALIVLREKIERPQLFHYAIIIVVFLVICLAR